MTTYDKFQELKKEFDGIELCHKKLNEWKLIQTHESIERWKTKKVKDVTSTEYKMEENWGDNLKLEGGIPVGLGLHNYTYEQIIYENGIKVYMDWESFIIIETVDKVFIASVYEPHGAVLRGNDVIIWGHEDITIVDTTENLGLFNVATR